MVQAEIQHFRVALDTASGWYLIRTTSGHNNQPPCRKEGHCKRLRFASSARHPPSSGLPYSSRPFASFSVAINSISSLLALPYLSARATGELMATIRLVRVLDSRKPHLSHNNHPALPTDAYPSFQPKYRQAATPIVHKRSPRPHAGPK